MNKKGNIPITVLVIGTFIVCIIALLAFSAHKNKIEKDISIFRYIGILNAAQNSLEFSNVNNTVELKKIYPSLAISRTDFGTSYYGVIKDLEIQGDYLVFKKMKRVWTTTLLIPHKTDSKVPEVEIKVKKIKTFKKRI